MEPLRDYLCSIFINNTYHFYSDCILRIDVVGIVADIDYISGEFVFVVNVDGKSVKIGWNTPKLQISKIGDK